MNSLQGSAATVGANTYLRSSSYINERNCISHLPNELKFSITQHLTTSHLGRLAQTSKSFYDFITPLLYTQDNKENWPRAIYWAVSVKLATVRRRSIIKVLDLSIKYGGDVNKVYHRRGPRPFYATPLHLATVSGKIDVVERLLEHKANPNAFGKNFIHFSHQFRDYESFESTELSKEVAVATRHTKWRPLFFAFIMEYEEMTQLLLESGASPVLAVTDDDGMRSMLEPGGVNVLHILASQQIRRNADATNVSYFKKYSSLINVPLPRGEAPLFTALRHGDDTMLRHIIANGGDLEGVNQMGRTPLIQAIICFYKGETPEIRKRHVEIIDYLVNSCNVNVGKHPDASVLQTPLTCAVMGFAEILPTSTAWKNAVKDMRAIIDLLLDGGADVNEVSSHGYTALSALCRVIFQKEHTGVLLDFFEQLIKTRGADIRVLFPNGHSILGACIVLCGRKPRKFYKILSELNATIVPHEADDVFKHWAGCCSFRNSVEFNIFDYSKHVTQDAIDFAYRACIDEDENILDSLQSHFPNTTVPEQIASEALIHDENHNKRFKAALKFKNFNGRYVHTDGNSLLHLIVDRYERVEKYTDSHAFADAKAVLLLDASVEAIDDWGRTALDKLMNMLIRTKNYRCPLRSLLQDIKGSMPLLRGVCKEKKYDKEQLRKDYKELIHGLTKKPSSRAFPLQDGS